MGGRAAMQCDTFVMVLLENLLVGAEYYTAIDLAYTPDTGTTFL